MPLFAINAEPLPSGTVHATGVLSAAVQWDALKKKVRIQQSEAGILRQELAQAGDSVFLLDSDSCADF